MIFRLFPKMAAGLPSELTATDGQWFALEKIHGAQLVVGIDQAGEVWAGKRKAWLQDTEAFFGWQLIRNQLWLGARSIRDELARQGLLPRGEDVVLYGELFGGGYPHADVPTVPALSPVQTGIWYAPDLRYAVFAILVAAPDELDGLVLGMGETLRLAEQAGLATPPVVGRGSRTEILQLSERGPSRVAGALGLPPIAGNVAEGFVARRDARSRLDNLVVFKRKIPEMKEADFDRSAAFSSEQRLPLPQVLVLLRSLVNRPRVESAGSKTGYEDEAALLDELELDVRIDLEAVLPATMSQLDADAEQLLNATIREMGRELLRRR